jgi:hypothetical protein
MNISQVTLAPIIDATAPWRADWLWGCPLIVVTVTLHTLGLAYMSRTAIGICNKMKQNVLPKVAFALTMAATTLLATALHGIEASIWGFAYVAIGVLPNAKSAMLYSLGAMTTFGTETVVSEEHWRLLGAIEALNGWLLFGLSTAFLFWLIQESSPSLRTVD